MDTRLLKHYEGELAYLRDMGAEFAASFPKIASRLGIDDVEVVDPYVERLLEGVAFLSARVQLELELQYPTLTSHLLEIIYPHYLCPTPSMMIANFEPDFDNAPPGDGFRMPRHTEIKSRLSEDDQTACTFRTAHDVTIWPIRITETEYIDGRGELVAAGVSNETDARAAIRLRIERHGNAPIAELTLNDLTLFLNPQQGQSWLLHELLCNEVTGLIGRSTDRRADWTVQLSGGVRPRGMSRDEALLPLPRQSFDGYRLLQEYFAMPERFHFAELQGLGPALSRSAGSDVDIYILLREGNSDVGSGVQPDAFALNATPACNLFRKRCDRVLITTSDTEQHVVADRTAPLDYEIFSLESVTGISGEGEDDVQFRPFYSDDDLTAAGEMHPAYYTQLRKMRQRTEKERLKGVRTSYLGSETYLNLVDAVQAPFSAKLQQLAVTAWVTNRDLPLLLSTGSDDTFYLPGGGPVKAIRTPVSPTRPRPTLAQGETAWRLISHLSLNYLSIAETDGSGRGAEALRELIGTYAPPNDKAVQKQLEGIVGIDTRPIVRRMTDEILSTAVRGLEIRITFDESFFEGTSAYLVASVLEQFFRKYASINSFTETVLITEQRGEVARWRAETGTGRLI